MKIQRVRQDANSPIGEWRNEAGGLAEGYDKTFRAVYNNKIIIVVMVSSTSTHSGKIVEYFVPGVCIVEDTLEHINIGAAFIEPILIKSPALKVMFKDDHKLKDGSVEATIDQRVEASNNLGGWGNTEYSVYGYGTNATEALNELRQLCFSLGVSNLDIDFEEVKKIDASVKERLDEQKLLRSF